VGGISIYDYFELELHPIRLALETQLGNKIVDYLIPERRSRREAMRSDTTLVAGSSVTMPRPSTSIVGTEPLDVTTPQFTVQSPSGSKLSCTLTPHQETKRKARPIASRSFSNLRSAAAESHDTEYHAPGLPKSNSSTALVDRKASMDSNDVMKAGPTPKNGITVTNAEGDASEMRQRSAQKTFVHVKIPRYDTLCSLS
jgi:BLTP2/FMP27/Hobbit, C-terminal